MNNNYLEEHHKGNKLSALLKKVTLIMILFFTVIITKGQDYTELNKVHPLPDTSNFGYRLGRSVALSGDYAVVGTPFESDIGRARLLHYDGSTWNLVSLLLGSDLVSGSDFGTCVDISDSTILVGASDQGVGGAAYVFEKPLGGWTDTLYETGILTASDGFFTDNFGFSASISDSTIVVGAWRDDDAGSSSGSAYVFMKPSGGWTNSTETAKLNASDGLANDFFGYDVSVFDSIIVVGAHGNDEIAATCGAAYVFTKPLTGTWQNTSSEATKLLPSDGGSSFYFGQAVEVFQNTIVVGAFLGNGTYINEGGAYIYELPAMGWSSSATLNETAILRSPAATNFYRLGFSVAIEDSIIVVGENSNDVGVVNRGKAYIYSKPAGGWVSGSYGIELVASDPELNDNFGYSVAVSSSHVLIGAPDESEAGWIAGATYFFEKTGPGWTSNTEIKKYFPELGISSNDAYFGMESISVHGDYAVIGSSQAARNKLRAGAADVFHYNGVSWERVATLTASDGHYLAEFGKSVAIFDSIIVIGAPRTNVSAGGGGAGYVFKMPATGWTDATETGKLTSSTPKYNNRLGTSVAIYGDDIVLGDAFNDDNGNYTGKVHVYTKPLTGWTNATETALLTSSDRTGGDYFGFSVDISSGGIVVGAYRKETNTGAAYVFTKPMGGWVDATEAAKLTASDKTTNYYFGESVAISGNTVAVGSPHSHATQSSDVGAVYVYEEPITGWVNDSTETAVLTANLPNGNWKLAEDIDFEGDKIIAGAIAYSGIFPSGGGAFVFRKPSSGSWTTATESVLISASDSDPTEYFGIAVAISEDFVVVGAEEDTAEENSGSAYFFQYVPKAADQPNVISGNGGSICNGMMDTISISPSDNLNDATQWVLYSGSCGGVALDSNASGVFTVSPSSTTDYFIQGTGGRTTGAMCGNISLVVLAHSVGSETSTICHEDTIFVNGTAYHAGNSSGTEVLPSANGCDSTVTINLNVLPLKTSSVTNTICNEDTIFVNGTAYHTGNPSGVEVFTGVGPYGCDSTVTINLNVLSALSSSITSTICNKDTIYVNGTAYHLTNPSGTEVFTGIGPYGCDSTVTINLNVLPIKVGSYRDTLCAHDTVYVNGTAYHQGNTSGLEVFTGVGPFNCDSTVSVSLSFFPTLTGTESSTICGNDSLIINGTIYNASNPSGIEVFAGVGPNGCDSTVTINLTVLPVLSSSISETICQYDTIMVNGAAYHAGNLIGVEIFTGIGPNGCDSAVSIDLTYNEIVLSTTVNGFEIGSNHVDSTSTYQWIDCDNGNAEISGATNAQFTATENGNYAVVITQALCSDTSDCVSISGVGLEKSTFGSTISVYPNPTSGTFVLNLTDTKADQVSIMDLTGAEIFSRNIVNREKIELSLNGYSAGIYYVKILSRNQQKIVKLIKQ